MMGKDCERIISGIDAVKAAAQASITSFSYETAYQLISREQHAGLGTGPCRPEEVEKPASNPMSSVSAAMAALNPDCGKMDTLSSTLYTGTPTFNNSLGSPWGELSNLQKAVADAEAYAGSFAPFNYVGEKAGMLAMLNMVMAAAVDAKWAMAVYHDYVQRGYDNIFNGNEPSITFQETLEREGIGNVKQPYTENVNIPDPPLDPF